MPGNLAFRQPIALTARTASENRTENKTWWRSTQSAANPSPPISLFNRENTGNFREFSPRFANFYALATEIYGLFS